MPFGERTTNLKFGSSDSVRQKFTGYKKDEETQLDFAEARMYENHHARFRAVDPLLASGKSTDPQTFNRYVYTMNRPLILTDPTGLQSGQPATNANQTPPDPKKPSVAVTGVTLDTTKRAQGGSKVPGQVGIDLSPGAGRDGRVESASTNLKGATITVNIRRADSDVKIGFVEGDQSGNQVPEQQIDPTTSINVTRTITDPTEPVVIDFTAVVPDNVPNAETKVTIRAEITSVTKPSSTDPNKTEVLTNQTTPNNAKVVIATPSKDAVLVINPQPKPPPVAAATPERKP